MVEGEILSIEESDDTITVSGNGFSKTIAKTDVLQENCAFCTHRNPVIHDELVGEPGAEQTDVDCICVRAKDRSL